jgi:two-component system response regulator HydG
MTPPARRPILVVDDSPETQEVLRRNLEARGFTVTAAGAVPEAIERLDAAHFDLVITDLKMPQISGIDLVRHVRENLPDTEVMMITGYATISSAVEAVKAGAEEYLSKPFTDEELFSAVARSLDKLQRTRAARGARGTQLPGAHGLVGSSSAMRAVYRMIDKTATVDATVLVTGPSGTGKELVARAIHAAGPRSERPFVPINCGAIPAELFESEVFGHNRGAFTGAVEHHPGLLLVADGGTILLDEVSEMRPEMQVKLLRVLQDGEVWPVGSASPRRVDVRVLAATNRDLRAMAAAGAFREDLYFRLGVITIEVPPLEGRGDDVILLARHFIEGFAAATGRAAPEFTDAAVTALSRYAWPGNVRELENLMHHLVVMVEGEQIAASDLPALLRFCAPRGEGRLDRTLAEMELEYVQKVLDNVGGNKTRAAKILGIDRKTLREKLKHSKS